MSDHDACEAPEATASQFRSLWGGFPQELPPDPRGKYFRVWADARPEEIAAVAGAVQSLENDLLRLAEIVSERHMAEVEQAQQPQTEATFGPPREAARLARLQAAQAAQAALKLAAELLAVDSPEQAQAAARQAQESAQAIAAWKHSGRGWFESRSIVKGYYAAQLPNEQTGDKEWWWLPLSFGPYRYFRWREPDPDTGALTTRTWYLGVM